MRWLRWWAFIPLVLSAPMMGQFIINSEKVAVSLNTSVAGNWPYTHTASKRTTSLSDTLFGGGLSLAMQWYLLSPQQRDKMLSEGQNLSGFVGHQLLSMLQFSLESEHSLLVNFADDGDDPPTLQQQYHPLSYYGRASLALSYRPFVRFQLNILGLGLLASSIDDRDLTYLYFAPLQRIRIDLPIAENFLRVEYEGSLLAFAYNVEARAPSDIGSASTLVGDFRFGWFMPSFYTTDERNRPYLGLYLGVQMQRHYVYAPSTSEIDWSQGASINRLHIGLTSWLDSPNWKGE